MARPKVEILRQYGYNVFMALQYSNVTFQVDKSDNPAIVTQSAQAVVPPRICVWCKGLRIDAGIDITQYVAVAGTTWEVGLVQILTYSKMKAHYGDVVMEWVQTIVPCYDSTNSGCIPWYTAATGQQITAVGPLNFTLQDYPTSHIDPQINNPGGLGHGNDLTHYVKHNKFDVYFVLRTKVNGVISDKFLKHCAWETRAEIRPNANWGGNEYSPAGYQPPSHARSTSYVYKAITAKLWSLPSIANGSANGAINQVTRQAVHRYRLHHH